MKQKPNRRWFIIIFIILLGCDGPELIKPSGISVDIEADAVTFAIIGDYGTDNENEKAVADLVKSFDPYFILTCGDNNYPDGATGMLWNNIGKYYCDFIYNFDAVEQQKCQGVAALEQVNRFFPSPGNHDYNRFYGPLPYLNYFTLPGNELYYDFKWGPVHFFSMDSNEDVQEQRQWFEQRVALTNKPFVVAYFHHPPYSVGKHGNSEKMQWDFEGVDLVVAGHDHIYSRIEREMEAGPVYIVNGIGGRSIRDCNVHPLGSGFTTFCYDDNYGAVKVEADTTSLHIQFVDVEGHVVDEFVIS